MSQIQEAMTKSWKAIREAGVDARIHMLCHYTSPSGLMGIFNDSKPNLFFSQYDSLNDTKERKDIIEALRYYCDKQLKNNIMSKKLYDDIMPISTSDLFSITRNKKEKIVLDNGNIVNDVTSMTYEECYTYICSFSKNNDSLPMWKMYSKADHYEGFCIEFASTNFTYNNCYKNGFNIELHTVIYDEQQKFDLIDKVISPIIKLYDSASRQDKEYLLSMITEMIRKFQFVFKNKSFSYEEEVRAILHIPKTSVSDTEYFSKRKYRQNNGLIVPYVEYYFDPSNALSITIAPTMKEEIAITNLKDYLCSKGLNHIDIISSDIPIRFI